MIAYAFGACICDLAHVLFVSATIQRAVLTAPSVGATIAYPRREMFMNAHDRIQSIRPADACLQRGSRPISLCGAVLGHRPHIWAFFSTPEERLRVLLPFIEEGLACGDKIVHTVDPARRKEELDRLAAHGIDVVAATHSGRLEQRAWTETHLRDGRFDQDETLGFFEQLVRNARQDGFPLVRFVTHMEWALENKLGFDDLLAYEAKANDIRRHQSGPINPVVCAYDLTKFSGEMLVQVLRTHPMTIIGGILQENPFFVPPEQFLRELHERRLGRLQTGGRKSIETKIEGPLTEDKRLKDCISDLISILSIPAISTGAEPGRIVGALLEVVLGMLRLDFASAEIKGSTYATPIPSVRMPHSTTANVMPREIGHAIEAWRRDDSPASTFVVQSGNGDGDISIVPIRLGLHDEIGWLFAGSRRADFPTQTERLLLGVAANQAAIAVQEARLLAEQKRVAEELDQLVAQRTIELQDANKELKRALKEIHELKDKLQRENIVLREDAAVTRGGLAPWQARRAKELMKTNLDGQVALSRVAEECGLSVRHFARAFRQSTGVPPYRWLLNQRVERAKELLCNPALPLTSIALTCGFSDQSHFTRVFTAAVRLSPGLWRRMQSWSSSAAREAAKASPILQE